MKINTRVAKEASAKSTGPYAIRFIKDNAYLGHGRKLYDKNDSKSSKNIWRYGTEKEAQDMIDQYIGEDGVAEVVKLSSAATESYDGYDLPKFNDEQADKIEEILNKNGAGNYSGDLESGIEIDSANAYYRVKTVLDRLGIPYDEIIPEDSHTGSRGFLFFSAYESSATEAEAEAEKLQCIMGIDNDGKRFFYTGTDWAEDPKQAKTWADLQEARSEWMKVANTKENRKRFKRIFVPNYDSVLSASKSSTEAAKGKPQKKTYKIRWNDTYHGEKNTAEIEATDIFDATKKLADQVALGGVGTANAMLMSISPNDGYVAYYGKVSDLLKKIKDGFYEKKKKGAKEAVNGGQVDGTNVGGGGPVSTTDFRRDFEDAAKRLKEIMKIGDTTTGDGKKVKAEQVDIDPDGTPNPEKAGEEKQKKEIKKANEADGGSRDLRYLSVGTSMGDPDWDEVISDLGYGGTVSYNNGRIEGDSVSLRQLAQAMDGEGYDYREVYYDGRAAGEADEGVDMSRIVGTYRDDLRRIVQDIDNALYHIEDNIHPRDIKALGLEEFVKVGNEAYAKLKTLLSD